MYQGQEKENRGAVRYALKSTAIIENLICDGKPYPLHTPVEVELVNISKSGVRFRAPPNALYNGDKFQMRMKISNNDKLLIAETVNYVNNESGTSDYGCRFLVASEKVV
jgi:hypothetical protein